jgi:arsenate reductase (thioredoxin)
MVKESEMKKILVLCTGNSCRSQMAEGWLRYYAGDEAEIYSAGIEAHGLNKYAVKVMADELIDISGYKSKTVDELPETEFDYVITVCDNAREKCPYFPAKTILLHKSFPDPSLFTGTEKEILEKFGEVRDEIEDFCFDFINNNIRPLIPFDMDNLLRI